jgi:VWFA-related protein
MHDRPIWIFSLVAAFLIFTSAVFAQSPTTQQAPASNSQTTVLHTTTNLVLVDVVVTDHDKAVEGLDRSRFHVFEDGRQMPLTAFDEFKSAAAQPGTEAQAPKLPPNTYSNVPAYPETSAVNVLLLDGLNTMGADQLQIRRQMLEYLLKIKPGTRLAVFTLGSRLDMAMGFTTDMGTLAKAVKEAEFGKPSLSQADQWVTDDLHASLSKANDAPKVVGKITMQHLRQFLKELTATQTDRRVGMTMEGMQQLARYLYTIPGRKNLIWFSGSFPLSIGPRGKSLGTTFVGMADYEKDLRQTSELLAAARVSVYPVDARGLISQPSLSASDDNSPGNPGRVGTPLERFAEETEEEDGSMEQIAIDTGGKAFVNTNNFSDALAKALQNGANYYTLAYVPATGKKDGSFHKIKVVVDNAKYRLSYRSGYYTESTDQPSTHKPGRSSLIAAAAQFSAPPATQILFQARVLLPNDPLLKDKELAAESGGQMTATLKGPVTREGVELKLDAHSISFDETPQGDRHAQLEIVLVVYDGNGRRMNIVERGLQLNFNQDQYAQAMRAGIPVRLAINLPNGQQALRIALQDLAAARVGSLEIPLAVGGQ